MKNKKALFTSNSEEWSTPSDLFNTLHCFYGFTLDPCATKKNAKCKKFFSKKQDGLKQSWKGETVFCNPPYGKEIGKWVEKAHDEWTKGKLLKGKKTVIVMLIPVRTDTKYWHKHILDTGESIFGKVANLFEGPEIYFIRGRLKFSNSKNSAPFPSCIVVWN